MILVISEAVSTFEKLNGKNKNNNTKQQYIEQNKTVHAWLGLNCCLLHSANSTASEPK